MLTQQELPLLQKERIGPQPAIKMSSLFDTEITLANTLQSNTSLQIHLNSINEIVRRFCNIQCKTGSVQHAGRQHLAFSHLRKYPEMLYNDSKPDLFPDSSIKLSSQKKREAVLLRRKELWKPSNLMPFNVSSRAVYYLEK